MVFSAHGVAPEVYDQARDPQPPGDRRDLPAGDQGPPRGEAVRRPRTTTSCSSATKGTKRSSVRPARRPRTSSSSTARTASTSVTVRDPAKVVWLSQTTLSVDETMETVARLKQRLPLLQSPPERRHLLRHVQPAARGQGDRAGVRRGDRGRLDELVQLGAAARGRARRRRPRGVPGRLRPRDRRRVARRRDDGRRDLRRERARRPGHGGARPAGRARLRRGRRGDDGAGEAGVRAAAGAAPRHEGQAAARSVEAAALAASVAPDQA